MRIKSIKSIGVVLGIVLLILIAPTVCASSMSMPAGMQISTSCGQQGKSTASGINASMDSTSHCLLVKAEGEQIKTPDLISFNNVYISLGNDLVNDVVTTQTNSPGVPGDILKIPISPPHEHHCRNLLTSEEPPL